MPAVEFCQNLESGTSKYEFGPANNLAHHGKQSENHHYSAERHAADLPVVWCSSSDRHDAGPAITEASGIAASRTNPGMYWVHNDSGDSARVFATDLSGAAIGRFRLQGAQARDWEDIAVGPGPEPGSSYLYLGDIGGNKGRTNLSIYRAVEPEIMLGATGVRGSVPAARIDVMYPDGLAWDAEALLVDPHALAAVFRQYVSKNRCRRA